MLFETVCCGRAVLIHRKVHLGSIIEMAVVDPWVFLDCPKVWAFRDCSNRLPNLCTTYKSSKRQNEPEVNELVPKHDPQRGVPPGEGPGPTDSESVVPTFNGVDCRRINYRG
jgi:hypothetical protein